MKFLKSRRAKNETAGAAASPDPPVRQVAFVRGGQRAPGPTARAAGSARREAGAQKPLEPGAREVAERLLRHGASRELTLSLVRRVVEMGVPGAYAIDAAARLIGGMIGIAGSPKRTGLPRVITFVGPTGAGKTTTLAKLGRRLSAARRSVVFGSLDAPAAGGLERVGGRLSDVDRTEIPLRALRSGGEVRTLLRRSRGADALLIDTPGVSPRDLEAIAAQERELASIGRSSDHGGSQDVYLVLPATASRASLELCLDAFSSLGPTAVAVTKLDEAPTPATVLECCARRRLGVAFLCDGQDVREHLVRPTPDNLADLFLRGRLAP